MKKFLATILALVYLSSSMGATLHLHYCMGKLISWGLVNHENKNCSFCGMPKSNGGGHSVTAKEGCCKDEHKQFKSDQDQKLSQNTAEFSKLIPEASLTHTGFQPYVHLNLPSVEHPTANAPPPGKEPVFLLNCNFRI